jgi:hypothetical protein
MDIFRQFDTYSLRARVFPALVAGLPTLALLFVLVPWDHFGLPHATVVAIGGVLLFAFADVARATGKRVEQKLGTRATPEQWHRGNTEIAEAAKDRYRAFIAKELKLTAPTVEDERVDPQKANDFYLSAGNWLREHTRDIKKFAILFAENVTYGYRRNLLGLRATALISNAIVACICVVLYIVKLNYFESLANFDEKLVAILAGVVLHSAYLLLAVGQAAVREASRAYGRQLILSCETLMPKPAPRGPRTPKPSEPKQKA